MVLLFFFKNCLEYSLKFKGNAMKNSKKYTGDRWVKIWNNNKMTSKCFVFSNTFIKFHSRSPEELFSQVIQKLISCSEFLGHWVMIMFSH